MRKIIVKIKQFIKNSLSKKSINYIHDNTGEQLVHKNPKLFAQTYGDNYPGKLFYIIRRNGGGAGFFSNLAHVIAHIKIAEDLNMLPVVDFKNFKTFYNEMHPVNGTENAWEYYFKPLSGVPLDEIYQSKHVFIADGEFPSEVWLTLRDRATYQALYNKYITPLPEITQAINKYAHIFNERILGVHFRGKEMNYTKSHPFGPTLRQILQYTKLMLKKYQLEKIFIVTEEKNYLEEFIHHFGDKVVHTDSFCIAKVNAYNLYPRENHKYKLGFEVLRDAILLSKCNALLCSESNVAEFAWLAGNHEIVYRIDNGYNSSNFILASFLYKIKELLPPYLGGLKNKVRLL